MVRFLFPLLFLIACTIQAETKFIKVSEDGTGKIVSLDTGTVSYTKGDLQVDLVGVIHIGDKSYYEKLNESFKQYDVVLFELVAPPGTRPADQPAEKKENPLALLQNLMKDAMQLDHQLKIVDYSVGNFVHADLSFEGMKKAAADRGEDKITIGLGLGRDLKLFINKQQRKQELGQAPPDLNPLALLLGDKNEGKKLKRYFAQTIKGTNGAGVGKTIENSLVNDRNEACLKVMKEQIEAGKKKIAIFYGAAHMPHFEKRLVLDFDLKKSGQTWQKAWDLK